LGFTTKTLATRPFNREHRGSPQLKAFIARLGCVETVLVNDVVLPGFDLLEIDTVPVRKWLGERLERWLSCDVALGHEPANLAGG
jgi:hypothetical protein